MTTLRLLLAAACLTTMVTPPCRAEPVVVQARFRADREALAGLDEQLWKPMMAAYAAINLEAYLAIFANDALFAGGDMPTLSPMSEWLAGTKRQFLVRRNEAGGHRREYRFTERAVYRDWSSERGVLAETDPNETRYFEFHYFARKIDGRWKITTAYRKRLSREIGAGTFAEAAPPGDYERF